MAQKEGTSEFATQCLVVADWLPARLLALTFALAGDFVGSRSALSSAAPGSGLPAREILHSVGVSALGGVSVTPDTPAESFPAAASGEVREFSALLSRSAASWLIIASLWAVLV